ncbi:DedA family protein [Georgenia sp. 311]|uniref:DedA family protein n=1 Tax=Georgenia wutianyii TaxID=2585135 RepID=A0ABX5VTB3_9MICO|nr:MULTISPECIES: DedA family protein [Georgenia]QDB80549.1 DedA family protein [Georgenia wutianyii]TNC18240.1 DedA family protein [Georgenia sp. 311]
MPDLITALPEAFSPALLVVAALLAFLESALGLGVLVPGELGAVLLGAAATTPVQALLALAVLTAAASAADHVGYAVGRRWGSRLRGTRLVRRLGTEHWDRAGTMLRRRGASALVVSRLLPLVRTLMPAAAGAARIRYRRFLAGSVTGTLVWAAGWLAVGTFGGLALPHLADSLGRLGWVVLAGLIVLGGLLVLWRRARQRALVRALDLAVPERELTRVPAPCPGP